MPLPIVNFHCFFGFIEVSRKEQGRSDSTANAGVELSSCVERSKCWCMLVCAVFVESTGALPPDVLFTEAVQILQSKANRIVSEILT